MVFILKQRASPPPVPGQVAGVTAGGLIAKGSAPIQLFQVLDPAVDQHREQSALLGRSGVVSPSRLFFRISFKRIVWVF